MRAMRSTRQRPPLSAVLRLLSIDRSRERISLGDLLLALEERALAALLFIFAFPNVIPTPPGTSTLLGAPLVFLAAQLACGRRPWLPAFLTRQSMSRDDFQTLTRRIAPWLERAERLLRPRLPLLTAPPMEYAVGVLCLLLAIVLVLPIPLGNIPPALAISLMALGILEGDGLWIIAGVIAAAASAAIVSGVIIGLAKAAFFLLHHYS